MNILHHKSYHVYNHKNKERVRKDEEKAKQEEDAKAGRTIIAEREHRLSMLRERAKQRQNELKNLNSVTGDDSSVELKTEDADKVEISDGHINFWADLEKQSTQIVKTNEEYEAEKKAKEKKSERQFTMYLDDVKEKTPWYVKLGFEEKDLVKEDKTFQSDNKVKSINKKTTDDPLIAIKSNLDKLSKKKSKDQTNIKIKTSSIKSNNEESNIEKLRAERLAREKKEKLRAQRLLNPGMFEEDNKTSNKRYNSQYNPNETKTAHDYWVNIKPTHEYWVKRSRNEQGHVNSMNNNNKRQRF